MGTVRAVFFLVGMTAGAGFLTGAELVRFFGSPGTAFLFACLLTAAGNAFFLCLGRKYGGCKRAVRALFPRGGDAVSCALFAVSFVPCAGMLAVLDALLPTYAPLPSLAGLAAVTFVLARGLRGVGAFSAAVVPFLLMLVVGTGKLGVPFAAGGGAGSALVYAGMNAAFSAPALMDAGGSVRRPLTASLCAAAVLFVCGTCILGGIGAASDPVMPYLSVVGARRVYTVGVACSVLTSLSSALFPLFSACRRLGDKRHTARAFVLLAVFVLSRVGMENVVGVFYPAAGIAGMLFLCVCVLDEYLFQQYHKGVHPRRKQTEKKGRAHHEVEFEDLPAVDDEISEPRARDDVFAHYRAYPAQTHGDFKRVYERGEGGGNDEL